MCLDEFYRIIKRSRLFFLISVRAILDAVTNLDWHAKFRCLKAWNFHMSCVSDGRLWLVVAARPLHWRRVGLNTAADDDYDQSFYHSAKLLSSFQHIPNNFCCRFRQVRSYDKEVITRLFSYRHLYQALGRHQPSTSSRADVDARAWYRCRYENSRVITSNYYYIFRLFF